MRLLYIIFLFLTVTSEAQTIAGGEVYYDLVGYRKYLVTAVVYRKCETAALTHLDGYVISDTIKVPMSLKRQSITLLEKGCGNPCNVQNSKSNAGYEKHTFTDTVDLNLDAYKNIISNGKCKVKFAVHQDIRNYQTTNLTNNISFYLDAEVNYCVNSTNVHSPKFSFDPKFKASLNQSVYYNPGTLDTIDFDDLSFEMVPPLSSINSALTYTNSFSQATPLSPYCPPAPGVINCRALPNADFPRGLYFDPSTGNMAFAPVNANEITFIKFKTTESRKDSSGKLVEIGYVTREMEMQVIANPAYTPVLKTIPEMTVCPESLYTKVIKITNWSVYNKNSDTIQYTWNRGIPFGKGHSDISMADTNPNVRELVFEMNPKLDQKDHHYLIGYMAYTNTCTENFHSNALPVNVNKEIKTIRAITPLSCSQYQYTTFPIDSSLFYDYQVNLYKTGSNQILQSSNLKSDLFNVTGNGTYTFENIINLKGSNCTYYRYDTIIAGSNQFDIIKSYKDKGCLDDSFTLSAPIKDFEKLNLTWKDLETGQTVNTKYYNGIVKRNSSRIELQMNGNPYCKNKDTLTIHPKSKFVFKDGNAPQNVCIYDQKLIGARTLDANYPVKYEWVINQSPLQYADSNLNLMVDANKNIELTVTDDMGCSFSDTLNFYSVEYPKISLENIKACKGTNATLFVKQEDTQTLTKTEWYIDGQNSGKSGLSYKMIVNKNTLINLKASNSFGCKSEANAGITMLNLPSVNIISGSNFNYRNRIIMSIDKTMKKYEWSNGDTTQQIDFWAYELGNPGQYYFTCKVTDSNSCSASVYKIIYTNQFTQIQSMVKNEQLIHPNPVKDVLWINSAESTEYSIYNTEGKLVMSGTSEGKIPLTELTEGLYIINFNGQSYRFMKVSE